MFMNMASSTYLPVSPVIPTLITLPQLDDINKLESQINEVVKKVCEPKWSLCNDLTRFRIKILNIYYQISSLDGLNEFELSEKNKAIASSIHWTREELWQGFWVDIFKSQALDLLEDHRQQKLWNLPEPIRSPWADTMDRVLSQK